jgi:signal transduction histidine kinase
VQHAGAVNVSVTVRQEPDRLLLSIQDDGKGFNIARERGMGLLGMQERVSNLEGTFEVVSEPSQGTGLRVSLPLVQTRDGSPMQTT